MTHYAQLSEALEYESERGERMVLRGSGVTLDELIDHYLAGELDDLCQAHPGVSNYHVQQVAGILADILRDVPDERHARSQLKRQAHWALLSEHGSRLIEKEADDLSDSPTREQLLTLVHRALARLQPQADMADADEGYQSSDAGAQSVSQEQPVTTRSGDRSSLQPVAANLTDCSGKIRSAANQLQDHHPIHAAYARELATRLDELLVDLLPPDRER